MESVNVFESEGIGCDAHGGDCEGTSVPSSRCVVDDYGMFWGWRELETKQTVCCTESPSEFAGVIPDDKEVVTRMMSSSRRIVGCYFNGWRLLAIKRKHSVLCVLSSCWYVWGGRVRRTKHTKLLELMAVWQTW